MPSFPSSDPYTQNDTYCSFHHSNDQDSKDLNDNTDCTNFVMADYYSGSAASSPGSSYYSVDEHSLFDKRESHQGKTSTLRRNERERNRVKRVNDGFAHLRKHVPLPRKSKKLSKVQTLRMAIDYIHFLQNLLDNGTPSDQALTTEQAE